MDELTPELIEQILADYSGDEASLADLEALLERLRTPVDDSLLQVGRVTMPNWGAALTNLGNAYQAGKKQKELVAGRADLAAKQAAQKKAFVDALRAARDPLQPVTPTAGRIGIAPTGQAPTAPVSAPHVTPQVTPQVPPAAPQAPQGAPAPQGPPMASPPPQQPVASPPLPPVAGNQPPRFRVRGNPALRDLPQNGEEDAYRNRADVQAFLARLLRAGR